MYTRDQVKDVVAYALARGIRVVPEFDVPAHTASWGRGYPELVAPCAALLRKAETQGTFANKVGSS